MAQAIKGRQYRHKKGGRYEVLELGKHSETQEDVVVYKSLDDGTVWVRPKSMFEDEGRFEFEGESDYDVVTRVAQELDILGDDLSDEDYGKISSLREELFAIGRRGEGEEAL